VRYRYGFNGKESDDEVSVGDGSYDFGARMYDARLGRWWSVDPYKDCYPMLSNYQSVANNPIFLIDPDGKQIIPTGDADHTTPQITTFMLECYFTTAFGENMAAVFMSSDNGGALGNFSGSVSPGAREDFVSAFQTELANISDDHTRSMAIGIYEAIMSNERVSVIVYLNNSGYGDKGTSTRMASLTVGEQLGGNNSENYFMNEPMVGGTSSAQGIVNDVDVLFDEKGPCFERRNLCTGLVVVSDGSHQNYGTLMNPSYGCAPGVTDGMGILELAVSTIEQISATERQLTHAQSYLQEFHFDNGRPANRQSSCRNEQQFFNVIAQKMLQNCLSREGYLVTPVDKKMSRQDRKDLGSKYSPRRSQFSVQDGN
jgi:RHS repeat-associated protein